MYEPSSAPAMRGPVADESALTFQKSTAQAGQEVLAEKWSSIVQRIRQGEEEATEEFYHHFYGGIRLLLFRKVGPQEFEDRIHNTFVILLGAIRKGEVRDPSRLPAFVRTVLERQTVSYVQGVIHERRACVDGQAATDLRDHRQSHEESLSSEQRASLMRELLQQMDRTDREILTRFYLDEHPREKICADLDLSSDQFRLRKSRAKIRFGTMAKRFLARRPLSSLLVRRRRYLQSA